MNLHADTEKFTIDVPHLGITLRTIMGTANTAASEMRPFRRRWRLTYKGSSIGTIQLANPK